MPEIHVIGKELEIIAGEIVAMFKKEQPEEARRWLADCQRRRKIAKEIGATWGDTGEGATALSIPSWVYFMYSRVLGTNDWFPNDKVAVAALLRAIPDAKIIETDGLCDADRR